MIQDFTQYFLEIFHAHRSSVKQFTFLSCPHSYSFNTMFPKDPKKQALVIFFVPLFLSIIAVLGFIRWDRGAFPGFKPEIVDVAIDDITRNHRGVRVHGMARHDVKIKQRDRNNADSIFFIYPLMPMNDMNSKEIKVMIRSSVPPDSMAMIEEKTIEGLARPPGTLVTKDVFVAWEERGYDFAEKFVLVDSFDEE